MVIAWMMVSSADCGSMLVVRVSRNRRRSVHRRDIKAAAEAAAAPIAAVTLAAVRFRSVRVRSGDPDAPAAPPLPLAAAEDEPLAYNPFFSRMPGDIHRARGWANDGATGLNLCRTITPSML